MRISDRSSDVCSSDLRIAGVRRKHDVAGAGDRGREAREPFLRPHGHDNLAFGVELDVETARIIIGLRAAEARNALRLRIAVRVRLLRDLARSEEHTSELQSLMRISYAVFCLKKK